MGVVSTNILEVNELKTYYRTRLKEHVYAVDGVSFSLERGRRLALPVNPARQIDPCAQPDGFLFSTSALWRRLDCRKRHGYYEAWQGTAPFPGVGKRYRISWRL